jgi:Omp85 superfamily domain
MLRRGATLAALLLLLSSSLLSSSASAEPAPDVPDPAPLPAPAPTPAPTPTPPPPSEPDVSVVAPPPSAPAPNPDAIQAPLLAPKKKKAPRVTTDTGDYTTRRFEPAGFPLIGGDSDIGFEFGAVGTLSYFCCGTKPYAWNMDLLLSASIKEGPTGAPEVAQQQYLWQIDMPGLFDDTTRLNPEVSYNHTVNYGYWGLGDASSAGTPATNTNPGRYHEWIDSVAQVRPLARVHVTGPLYVEAMAQYLYVSPQSYDQSLLSSDATASAGGTGPRIYGTSNVSLPSLALGFAWDSRDNEIFPHSGMLHEVGVRVEEGFPTSTQVHYVESGAILRGYVPLFGPFVLAGRFIANFQVGNVPFFELFQAGPFDLKEMPGGSAGIRGVPVGRYLGPIKVLGNVELRSMLVQFTVLKQHFSIGDTIFFDTGRVWSDYSFHSPLDGTGVGLKYGVGGGIYVLWGQAAMLRIEAGYSPDAVSENPSLPLGIYVNDGVMF